MDHTLMHWYMHVVMPALLALMAVCMLGLGLRALITRRPFIFSARWLLLFLLLGFAPNLLMPLFLRSGGEGPATSASLAVMDWFGPAMFVVLLIVFSIQLRGYLAMAVSEASLREALLASLARLRLPHEETLSSVRLPSVPGELQVAVQGWMGTAQLKARNRQSKAVLAEIVQQMNLHFRTQPGGLNLVCPVTYTVMGALLLAMDAVLVSL